MDYTELGEKVLRLVGGTGNVASHTNCMTRLRINVEDQAAVDVAGIRALDGVQGVVDGPQLQIVVGPGHAERLREGFGDVLAAARAAESGSESDVVVALDKVADDVREAELGSLATRTQAKVKARQTSRLQVALKHVGNIFIPLFPGFIACGIIAAIANIWKLIDPSVTGNPWFLVFAAMGTLLIGSLNLIVGLNTAKEFGGSPVLGFVAGGLPYLPALAGIAANPKTGGEAVPLTIPVVGQLSPGLGGVIGVMATAWLFAAIEKRLRARVPASLDLFVVPVFTVLVGAVVSLFVIMPIAALVMRGVTWFLVDFALEQGGVFGGFLMSALFLPLVMLGLHHGLTPVHVQLIADLGYTPLLPILAMAGAGQDGAAIAIWLKTRNPKLKRIIKGALPLGLVGIGEPLIYGVSLPLFYPFITACLGAGFGGAFVAWGMEVSGGFGAQTIGLSGVLMTGVISAGGWLWYLGGIAVGALAGFVLTYLFGFKESMESRLA